MCEYINICHISKYTLERWGKRLPNGPLAYNKFSMGQKVFKIKTGGKEEVP